MSSLPPALAVGALYDSFLQNALKQFFSRATFGAEPILSASSDGRLAIEPSDDPCVLTVRWFGSRYTLRVPEGQPFTEHETRFARAIGSVLAARYRAILNPKFLVERGELFRGRDRRPLRRRVPGRLVVRGLAGPAARRSHRLGYRGHARGRAEQLRESSDLDWRPAARHAGGSGLAPSDASARQPSLLTGAHGREELLPPGGWTPHVVRRGQRRDAARHRGRAGLGLSRVGWRAAECTVPGGLRGARTRNAPQRTCVSGSQPLA